MISQMIQKIEEFVWGALRKAPWVAKLKGDKNSE